MKDCGVEAKKHCQWVVDPFQEKAFCYSCDTLAIVLRAKRKQTRAILPQQICNVFYVKHDLL